MQTIPCVKWNTPATRWIKLLVVLCLIGMSVSAQAAGLAFEATQVTPSVSTARDDAGVQRADTGPAAISRSLTTPTAPARFTVLHTNDLHSNLSGLGPDALFTPQTGDGDPVLGHAARLMTAIRQVRAERRRRGEPVLTVDAGDALFGSLFHILGPSRQSAWIPEYCFFHAAGYDVLSLGNHDFDAEEAGLAYAWHKARRTNLRLPFVSTNLRLADAQAANCPLKPFFQPGGAPTLGVGCQEFQIRDLPVASGQVPVRVGILGLVGPNAALLSVATRKTVQFVGFKDQGTANKYDEFYKLVQAQVEALKTKFRCQVVLVVLHGGTPEDEDLAREVKGIDLIIAAHTHAAYVKKVGTTVIAQSGHGGANLGCLDLEYGPGGLKLLNEDKPRIAIDDTIPAAADVLGWLKRASDEVDRIISPAGFRMSDPICDVTRDRRKELFPNNAAGVFVANALRRAANRHLAELVDVYFSSYGMVRSEFLTVNGAATPYAFSDVFRFSPLGFDEDGQPGAPVVVFSLSPLETKILLEVMTYLSKKTKPYEPAVSSSLRYQANPHGVPLVNRLTDLTLHGKAFRKWPKRVRIATTLFFAKNLLQIRDMSKGLLRITPRDDDGNAITEFKDSGLPREHLLLADELRRTPACDADTP